jgi:hypothetical protein
VAAWKLDPFSTDVDLGLLNTGDTLSYVYTLTAEGTTHGFERGYQAFLGDPLSKVVRPTCRLRLRPRAPGHFR